MGCHFLLQGIFLIQGSNLHRWHLLHWQAGSTWAGFIKYSALECKLDKALPCISEIFLKTNSWMWTLLCLKNKCLFINYYFLIWQWLEICKQDLTMPGRLSRPNLMLKKIKMRKRFNMDLEKYPGNSCDWVTGPRRQSTPRNRMLLFWRELSNPLQCFLEWGQSWDRMTGKTCREAPSSHGTEGQLSSDFHWWRFSCSKPHENLWELRMLK